MLLCAFAALLLLSSWDTADTPPENEWLLYTGVSILPTQTDAFMGKSLKVKIGSLMTPENGRFQKNGVITPYEWPKNKWVTGKQQPSFPTQKKQG